MLNKDFKLYKVFYKTNSYFTNNDQYTTKYILESNHTKFIYDLILDHPYYIEKDCYLYIKKIMTFETNYKYKYHKIDKFDKYFQVDMYNIFKYIDFNKMTKQSFLHLKDSLVLYSYDLKTDIRKLKLHRINKFV